MRKKEFCYSLGIFVMFVTLKQGRNDVECSTRLCSVRVAHERPVWIRRRIAAVDEEKVRRRNKIQKSY